MLARNDFVDFYLIGAGPKEALWLQRTLGEHPSIALPKGCSPAIGRRVPELGQLSYTAEDLDRWRAKFKGAGPLTVLGGINPDLMLDPNAASRLSQSFPQMKLIAFLRDPADLIVDLYRWQANNHGVRGEIAEELERHPEWLDRARYHRHLVPFIDRFHPDQICLVIYERFFAQEFENFQRLCRYLDVDTEFRPSPICDDLTEAKKSGWPGQDFVSKLLSRTDNEQQYGIDDETRCRIYDQLSGEMNRLEHALGIDLDLWRGQKPSKDEHPPAHDNVIQLPSGAERRQRLAGRRSIDA